MKTKILIILLAFQSQSYAEKEFQFPMSCQHLLIPSLKEDLERAYSGIFKTVEVQKDGSWTADENQKPQVTQTSAQYEMKFIAYDATKRPSAITLSKVTADDLKHLQVSSKESSKEFYKMRYLSYNENGEVIFRRTYIYKAGNGHCELSDIYVEEGRIKNGKNIGTKQQVLMSAQVCDLFATKKKEAVDAFVKNCSFNFNARYEGSKSCDEMQDPHSLKGESEAESEMYTELSCESLKKINGTVASAAGSVVKPKSSKESGGQ